MVGTLKGAGVALLRLLVNGSQVQQAPQLTIVPGEAAAVAWVNASALASGVSVIAGEEGYAELATLDAFGNRITSAAVGITAELKHESGIVRSAADSPRSSVQSAVSRCSVLLCILPGVYCLLLVLSCAL